MMKQLFFLLLVTTFIHSSFSQEKFVTESDPIAFEGYDLTTYFDGTPQKGKSEHTLQYENMSLQFTTAENKKRFLEDPEAFMPAYGGWCATAMIYGNAVRPDFSRYKIQNGKILFFEVKAFFNGLTQWEKDPSYNEVMAEAQFMKYVRENNEN